jgi:excisionase family DNA binding protein
MAEEKSPREEFLTVKEVAETLKLNQQTVRNWIDSGYLPAVRIGRRVRIKRSDFDQLVERGYQRGSGRQKSAPEEGPRANIWAGDAPPPPVTP